MSNYFYSHLFEVKKPTQIRKAFHWNPQKGFLDINNNIYTDEMKIKQES